MEIVPSLLAEEWSDFLVRLRQAELFAPFVQVDLMDGQFVPTTSFPPEKLRDLVTGLGFEAHLMVMDPVGYLKKMRNPALKRVIFQIESATDPLDAVHHIEERGAEAAIAFRPETSFVEVAEILGEVRHLLFLTVDPGRYGSPFRPEVLTKVREARRTFPDKVISVDGGVSLENLRALHEAGADYAVVGSRIFLHGDPAENYRLFVEAAEKIGREKRPG